jgi:L-alanine-DL-glutamate epimerase-like enolase superfamily enzyme
MPLCKAAIDFACYDIAGKQAGQSVSELLGGAQRNSLELNWTVASPNMATIEQQLTEGRERGYAHYTVKIGPPQTLEYDVQLIHTVRDFAPDSFLWTDANTNYSLEAALEIAQKLADAGFQAFESPLPPSHLRGFQSLKKQGAVPIYMDEGIISPNEVGEFIALNMFDGITLKPARCAGLWASQQIVNCVKENGLNILASGLSDPDISLAGAVHLFAWADVDKPCALNGPQNLTNTLIENYFIPTTGRIQVPDQPGLGIELSERAAAVLKTVAEL